MRIIEVVGIPMLNSCAGWRSVSRNGDGAAKQFDRGPRRRLLNAALTLLPHDTRKKERALTARKYHDMRVVFGNFADIIVGD